MTDPVFFKHGAGLTVGEIAALTGAAPRDGADLDRRIYGVAALDIAGPSDLVFFDKPRFAATLAESDAGACIATEALEAHVPPHIAALRSRDPHGAFIAVTKALFPTSLRPPSAFGATGIAEGAIVHATARLESGVTVEPGAVIGPRVEIGFDTVIASGAVIAADVRIGRGCSIGACVSIMCAFVGDRVIIHPGVRIGNDGFGYLPGAKHRKIPQLGRVIIQDDVEIGANAMIDRGSIRDTVIGEGTKIDNAVQIAHNVQIGRHCILAAQIGISGSAVIGDYVMMGGQVGVADHFTIGEGAIVAAQSGVMSDIPAGQRWGGYPARPLREWLRHAATQRNVARASGRDVPSLGEGER